ncbi:hypothetical protein E2C01_079979 [Portunus trituberculatus]|uniref:Uncharacterized protein n=1 Tax=Portunus trituberculatus TaxID=210409 RepID=A0A5B7IRY2_PORTR|nr:hypothetical protein [Portunus trituberculatus]
MKNKKNERREKKRGTIKREKQSVRKKWHKEIHRRIPRRVVSSYSKRAIKVKRRHSDLEAEEDVKEGEEGPRGTKRHGRGEAELGDRWLTCDGRWGIDGAGLGVDRRVEGLRGRRSRGGVSGRDRKSAGCILGLGRGGNVG